MQFARSLIFRTLILTSSAFLRISVEASLDMAARRITLHLERRFLVVALLNCIVSLKHNNNIDDDWVLMHVRMMFYASTTSERVGSEPRRTDGRTDGDRRRTFPAELQRAGRAHCLDVATYSVISAASAAGRHCLTTDASAQRRFTTTADDNNYNSLIHQQRAAARPSNATLKPTAPDQTTDGRPVI